MAWSMASTELGIYHCAFWHGVCGYSVAIYTPVSAQKGLPL
jgi:hypothetical protein